MWYAVLPFLLGHALQLPGQMPIPPVVKGIPDDQYEIDRIPFAIDDVLGIRRQLRWQEVAAIDCRRILLWRLEGRLHDRGNREAARAARLLGSLRDSDKETVDLLCRNLTLRPSVYTTPHWLNGYIAAEALIQIGGPQVANSVIDLMKGQRSGTELKLCAKILQMNDSREITFERFRLASEKAETELTGEEHGRFVHNLTQVREWLTNPHFALEERYLPK